MNDLTSEVWLEQAALMREIQHLKTAARLLAIGKPERARASEAAMDLATKREALLLDATHQMFLHWPEAERSSQAPQISDHGDQLLWLVKHFKPKV